MDFDNLQSVQININTNDQKLNDVVMVCFVQYGVPYTVEHFIAIREQYYSLQQRPEYSNT